MCIRCNSIKAMRIIFDTPEMQAKFLVKVFGYQMLIDAATAYMQTAVDHPEAKGWEPDLHGETVPYAKA